MKTIKFISAATLALALTVTACSQGPSSTLPDGTSAKDLIPSKARVDSVSYLIGVNFGTFIKGYNFGEDLNYAEIEKGIKDFVKAKGNQNDPEFLKQFRISPEEMNNLFNSYLEQRVEYAKAYNSAEGKKFLADNLRKEGVQQTASGLQYKIIEPGNDVKPVAEDTVTVRYRGTLLDGTVFDETPADSDPIEFTLNRVIPGWQEGLQLIGEGGKAQLFIPAELAYGERGAGDSIQPNATLIFDVELISVARAVAEPAE
ncbi:MAG: FKBP-type peptidyl-prolyl cis-trans isomerase [Bacteroidales bacterium]|nr:FKBP-type peptidyl-prolyl cis-trans isomerase [Bacteroidales bacterium]